MRISDWSSDVCSSDLQSLVGADDECDDGGRFLDRSFADRFQWRGAVRRYDAAGDRAPRLGRERLIWRARCFFGCPLWRSEEHTSELQSLMRISYAVFCLKKKTKPATTCPKHWSRWALRWMISHTQIAPMRC